MHSLVEKIERKHMKRKVPTFSIGDQVKVHTKIVEGDKERIQIYQGTVVAKSGKGVSVTFTVSRISFGYANEKIFQLHSPNITNIEVLSKGIVRRAKLNYLRGKLGKAAKVRMQVGKQVTAEETVLFEEEVVEQAAAPAPEAPETTNDAPE
ncbi:50S ribosomal protein L19 [bacterium]|nr:50S ribosomal protein L19 [bacterium]